MIQTHVTQADVLTPEILHLLNFYVREAHLLKSPAHLAEIPDRFKSMTSIVSQLVEMAKAIGPEVGDTVMFLRVGLLTAICQTLADYNARLATAYSEMEAILASEMLS